ncbi:PQQ-dependent catabolism-associated CXXCW motif protein [Methylosinus sp. H3A]|uniref:PQQ-dependent catabolism-associated CXXCW motif protein n=1 Tax=Methylosinus sp. H3A TaxID=2785786 RepID=UPI0018C3300D|nr:PQQ-dependent catabolism-associated CXXCW motif protein [Methylosinus sp. H3A]MBG0810134.1 PQQ-dependent catabolism-associated CXXCW motif protein [Methylosinus sp. H3A]
MRSLEIARGFVAALGIASLAAGPAVAEPAPEPEGYRLSDYRAAVPAALRGARVIDTPQAFVLWQDQAAIFVDVLPRPPKPAGLPLDAVWRDKPRFDIPGSVWLPETGYGELPPASLRYFESGLERATAKDKRRPLVFYCLADCWMSWNAAKRALALGYSNVSWFPQGTDGWSAAGRPLEPREPEPRKD